MVSPTRITSNHGPLVAAASAGLAAAKTLLVFFGLAATFGLADFTTPALAALAAVAVLAFFAVVAAATLPAIATGAVRILAASGVGVVVQAHPEPNLAHVSPVLAVS